MDLARHVPASEMKTGPSLQPRPSPSIWASNRLHWNSILQAESTFCATKCRYSSSRSSTVHCKPPPTLISFVPFFMTLAYLKATLVPACASAHLIRLENHILHLHWSHPIRDNKIWHRGQPVHCLPVPVFPSLGAFLLRSFEQLRIFFCRPHLSCCLFLQLFEFAL